jgi:hypothetical protein
MDDVERWAGERPTPVAEQLGRDRKRCSRDGPGVCQPLDRGAVRRLRSPTGPDT